jgi:hypothetical protein
MKFTPYQSDGSIYLCPSETRWHSNSTRLRNAVRSFEFREIDNSEKMNNHLYGWVWNIAPLTTF